MADKQPTLAADPFAEFGEPEAPTSVDPFAEFGAPEAVTAPAEAPPLQAGVPVPEIVSEVGGGLYNALDRGAGKVVDYVQTAAESLVSPFGLRAPVAAAEALPNYLADVVTPGVESDFGKSFQSAEQAMLKRKEENPTADIVGQVGQALAAPVGLAGKAVQAVESMAPAVVSQAVRKVPGLLSRYLGETATGVVGRIATAAGLGAAESVAQGVTSEVDQSLARGTPQGLAEKIDARLWDDAKTGALWGAGAAGAVEGVKVVLKGLKGRAADVVDLADEKLTDAVSEQRRTVDEADELHRIDSEAMEANRTKLDALGTADEMEAQAQRALEEQQAATARKVEPVPADPMARYVAAYEGHKNFRAHADASVTELKSALDVLEENGEFADKYLGIATKNAANRAAENGYGQAIRDPEVTGLLDQLVKDARATKVAALDPNSPGLKRVETLAKRAQDMVQGKLSQGDVGDAFTVLDNLKREVGYLAANPKRSLIKEMSRGHYDTLKTLMEREDLFGEAAKLQKPFNAVWAPEIGAAHADALSGMLGDTGAASKIDKFVRSERVKGSFVEGHLKSTAVNTDTDDALRQYIATKAASQSVRADLLAPSLSAAEATEALARAANARAAASKAIKILDDNARLKNEARDWANLNEDLEAEKLVNSSGVKGVVKDVINGLAANKTARLVGAGQVADATLGRITKTQLERDLAAATLQSEKRAVAQRAAAQRLAETARKAEGRKLQAVKRLQKLDAWDQRARPLVEEQLNPAVRRAGITKAIQEAERENDPADDKTGPLSRLEPVLGTDLAQAVMAQRQARNAFLLDKAGPAPAPTPFGTPKRELADADVVRLAAYKDAADDPIGALERISSGKDRAEDLETLKALHPSTLAEFRADVLSSFAERSTPPSYEQQLALSDALGLPLAAELQPQAVAFWSQVAQSGNAQAEQKEAKRGKLKLSDATSRGDRLG